MLVAHLAFILLVSGVLIATVLSPFYTDIFKTGDIWAKHFSAKMFIILLERLSIASLFVRLSHFFILSYLLTNSAVLWLTLEEQSPEYLKEILPGRFISGEAIF